MTRQIEPVIGLYSNLPADCQDYDPRAALVAGHIARVITSHLPMVTVEHVGSTAVPGCAGKGVVDLVVLYQEGQLDEVKALLEALGFQKQGSRDPFPEERPMRVGALEYAGKTFRLHAHVLAAEAAEVSRLRHFRDRLRSDPKLLAAYVKLKRAIIAAGVTDTVDYCHLKDDFISAVLNSPR